MTVEKILTIARSQLGIKENPPNSNRVKFNTAYYGQEVSGSAYPWCCAFVWWVFREAGASRLFYGGKKTASCSTLLGFHKAQAVRENYLPGDIIFFNFDGKRNTQHVGICEGWDGRYITTIDGNTAPTNEANGGAVMRRRRPKKYIVGAYRPTYEEDNMDQSKFNQMFRTAMTEYRNSLRDNDSSAYSEEARRYVVEKGIFSGSGTAPDGQPNFMWEDLLTREQCAQVLYNFAQKHGLA
jgi:hypothetical protein